MSATEEYRAAKRAHCLACWPDMCVCGLDDAVRAYGVECIARAIDRLDDEGFPASYAIEDFKQAIAAELLPKE